MKAVLETKKSLLKILLVFLSFSIVVGLCSCSADPSAGELQPSDSGTDSSVSATDVQSGNSHGSEQADWSFLNPPWETVDGLTSACVAYGTERYTVRNTDAEVYQLGEDWVYVGTIERSEPRDYDFGIGVDLEGIASNCMPIGSKVYQWQYLLAVEYEDFYVIFKDTSAG